MTNYIYVVCTCIYNSTGPCGRPQEATNTEKKPLESKSERPNEQVRLFGGRTRMAKWETTERERERKQKKGKEGEGDQWNSQVKKHLNMHRIRALWILMVSKESENIYCRVICLRICFNFILLSLFILLFALSLFLPLSLLLYVSFYICCVLLISLLFSFSKNLKGVQARQRWLSQIERTLSMNTLQSYSKTKRKKRK